MKNKEDELQNIKWVSGFDKKDILQDLSRIAEDILEGSNNSLNLQIQNNYNKRS